ncbi:hypothetical protein N7E02_08130 [Aliirhizobium terrae]|uniref:hypothetical protein n=1 Tax=Terrirhizobium terrae TaxID=2926709 RepID=UPI002575DB61|nr:hypothetical protein [Rhizobium sp. CC-CFT758]WJH40572.1 hypothetical protein N7E02_08130 [Rhizobium sp. CC-CFT758]
MAEVATGVAGLLVQPYRLEINVQQLSEPLLYFPDMELFVDDEFIAELGRGRHFGWPRRSRKAGLFRRLSVEGLSLR